MGFGHQLKYHYETYPIGDYKTFYTTIKDTSEWMSDLGDKYPSFYCHDTLSLEQANEVLWDDITKCYWERIRIHNTTMYKEIMSIFVTGKLPKK